MSEYSSYLEHKERVKAQLRAYGSCDYGDFEPRIKKLHGVINELKKQGWKIETRTYQQRTTYYLRGEPEVSVFPGDKPVIIEPQEQLFDEEAE